MANVIKNFLSYFRLGEEEDDYEDYMDEMDEMEEVPLKHMTFSNFYQPSPIKGSPPPP